MKLTPKAFVSRLAQVRCKLSVFARPSVVAYLLC